LLLNIKALRVTGAKVTPGYSGYKAVLLLNIKALRVTGAKVTPGYSGYKAVLLLNIKVLRVTGAKVTAGNTVTPPAGQHPHHCGGQRRAAQ